VTRGLSVGTLEARDRASGTPSRSSKLIHGGLRYLETLDFRLERRAAAQGDRALPRQGRGERASQQQPDDETADSARMGAPEIVPLA
jgi:hypothetical protein